MTTKALTKGGLMLPTLLDDYLLPFDEWFDGSGISRRITMPSVNITENKDDFNVALAVPGMKKDDFKIDLSGNLLTVSCEKEEKKKGKDGTYSHEEYNYSSFSRSFTLPEDVDKENIDAHYQDGVLNIKLSKKEEARKNKTVKQIYVS
ncbi:MAG: Hsp20/alpha crystallin family protein [Ginsengibacter sp.]